jgi:acetylornithine deacetylase/succinyl-diaminopimelate desuccinylase-like protein
MSRDMRKLAATLVLVFLANIFTFAQRSAPDFAKARDEAVSFLSELIKINTSDPPGNETKAAEYLKEVLEREGIASLIVGPSSDRGSVIARLKGSGAKKPLLLMGHLDVVPVERDKWTFDPFGGVVKDGYVYGRGAIDDKGSVATNLEVFLLLHRLKLPLDRDVILFAESGEENDAAGIRYAIEHNWNDIACEFVLNEGGSALIENGKVKYVGISTTEKVPRGLILRATGTSGHGSVPRTDNAVVHLAAAVAKVGTWETPTRLNETTREFFRRLAQISPPDQAAMYSHVEEAGIQRQLRTSNPSYYSALRTSVVPTILKAGIKGNVIPATAEARLDVRALPDEDMDKLIAQMQQVIADPQVEVVKEDWSENMPAAAPSPLQTDAFRALERAQQKVYPRSTTLPVMTTGATDSAFLRAKGVQAYGISMANVEADRRRVHGNDERAPVDSIAHYVEFVYSAVVDIAGGR